MFYADGFFGASYEGSETETINYFSKNDTEISIAGALPKYYNQGTHGNVCANVAGATVLGFYDRYNEELIPGFQAARVIRDRILYSTQTSAVQSVIDELYIRMETNTTPSGGTSAKGFRNGLQSYVLEKGGSVSYSPVVQNQEVNIELYKNAVNNERPIVLFVSKYTLIPLLSIAGENNEDILEKQYFGGNHVLIAYGIREINYYSATGSLEKSIKLLLVATGYNQDSLAYIMLDNRITIIEGYEIKIY